MHEYRIQRTDPIILNAREFRKRIHIFNSLFKGGKNSKLDNGDWMLRLILDRPYLIQRTEKEIDDREIAKGLNILDLGPLFEFVIRDCFPGESIGKYFKNFELYFVDDYSPPGEDPLQSFLINGYIGFESRSDYNIAKMLYPDRVEKANCEIAIIIDSYLANIPFYETVIPQTL